MPSEYLELDRYLDEVSAHLPRRKDRADLISELRSTLLDRAEEIGEGRVTAESVHSAVEAAGEAAEVALAFTGEKYVVGPRHYPSFVTYTGIVFAIHLVMIVAATAFDAAIAVFPLSIPSVAGPGSILRFLVAAIQALLFDIGLMVVLFTVAARARPGFRLPGLSFPVRTGLRHCVARAVLAVVAFLAFNVFRDEVFVVWTEVGPQPLLTGYFLDALPAVDALLALLVLREVLYIAVGERRWVLATDGLTSALGAALMIWLITRPALLAFHSQVPGVASDSFAVNHFVAGAFRVILAAFAAAFTFEALKRFHRLRKVL